MGVSTYNAEGLDRASVEEIHGIRHVNGGTDTAITSNIVISARIPYGNDRQLVSHACSPNAQLHSGRMVNKYPNMPERYHDHEVPNKGAPYRCGMRAPRACIQARHPDATWLQ